MTGVLITLQAYFSKMPAKICNLRVDTLAIMLSQANVQAHARVSPWANRVHVTISLASLTFLHTDPEVGTFPANRVVGHEHQRKVPRVRMKGSVT